ncbi:MAG: hypothetical protein ACLQVL_14745, partial [Terriglobia bacterium]
PRRPGATPVPLHSLRPGNPHAKPTLSSLSTTENPFSAPAEFRESLSLFPISRLPPAEAYLTESLVLPALHFPL